MEGALEYDNIVNKFDGIRINVQGFGNVSYEMIKNILYRGLKVKSINVFDIYDQKLINKKIDQLLNEYPESKTYLQLNGYQIKDAKDNSMLFDDCCDIISPCATGGTLNQDTIPNIKARYIAGAANNQLLDESDDSIDDKLLYDNDILYVPDFLANRMGVVNCANEPYGFMTNDSSIERHFGHDWENSIINMTKNVFSKSRKDDMPSAKAAKEIAQELMKIEHPIWGHRSRYIQADLLKTNWHLNAATEV